MKTKLSKQFKRPFGEAEDDWDDPKFDDVDWDKRPDFDPNWINNDMYIAWTDDYYRRSKTDVWGRPTLWWVVSDDPSSIEFSRKSPSWKVTTRAGKLKVFNYLKSKSSRDDFEKGEAVFKELTDPAKGLTTLFRQRSMDPRTRVVPNAKLDESFRRQLGLWSTMLNEAMDDKTDMTLSEFTGIVDPKLDNFDRFCAACGKMLDDGEVDEIDIDDGVMHICGVAFVGQPDEEVDLRDCYPACPPPRRSISFDDAEPEDKMFFDNAEKEFAKVGLSLDWRPIDVNSIYCDAPDYIDMDQTVRGFGEIDCGVKVVDFAKAKAFYNSLPRKGNLL